jgi:hypothetical protein
MASKPGGRERITHTPIITIHKTYPIYPYKAI